MSGPWEDYAAPATDGPWSDYAKPKSAPVKKGGGIRRGVEDRARAFTQGAFLGFGDEIEGLRAGRDAVIRNALGAVTGREKFAPVETANKAYTQTRDYERGEQKRFSKEHPVENVLWQIGGGLATPGLGATGKFIGGAKSFGGAVGRSAAVGAGYGAAAGAGNAEGDFVDRAKGAAVGGAVGGVFGAAVPVAVRGGQAIANRPARVPTTAQSDAATLKDIGVSTTVMQRWGKQAKSVEDLMQRFPILGQAVGGARDRQVEQLNRGIGLKALEPLGVGLPRSVKPGFEMVEHVDDAIGAVYDRAAAMVPVAQIDDVARNEYAAIAARKADLAPTEAAQFDSMMAGRFDRLSSPNASGKTVKTIHSELGKLQAEQARKGNSTLSEMIGDTRRALMGIIERADPQAGALVKRADKAWGIYSIMNDASAAASNRGGVFLPGQLNSQVRAAGRRMGSNMTGKGKAPLQDIATAATRMLPDSFGNPGTANTLALGSGLVGMGTAPVQTITAAAGLGAAATPYLMMARKIIEELPNAAPAQRQAALQQLQSLAAKDPAVKALIARMVSPGMIGAQAGREVTNPLAGP